MKKGIEVIILYLMIRMVSEVGIVYSDVSLKKIKEQPQTYKNTGVRIKVVFNKITDNWAPVFTFFTPEKYINFAAWGYDQQIWFKKSLLNDYPYFYIRKDNPHSKKIVNAERFSCMILKGVVSNIYAGRAWIEVEEITTGLTPCINEEILSLAIKANENFRKNNFVMALYYAEKLNKLLLPPILYKRNKEIMCFCYLQTSLKKKALSCYEELFNLTQNEQYRILIEQLQTEQKEGSNNTIEEETQKLRAQIEKKEAEIKMLKKKVSYLEKVLKSHLEPPPTVVYTAGPNFTSYTNENDICLANIKYVRRNVEERLPREKFESLINSNHKCKIEINPHLMQKAEKVVKEAKRRNYYEPYLPPTSHLTIRVFRRTLERRLDREEFEYLLKNVKNQL
jgi:hypothetical protein